MRKNLTLIIFSIIIHFIFSFRKTRKRGAELDSKKKPCEKSDFNRRHFDPYRLVYCEPKVTLVPFLELL